MWPNDGRYWEVPSERLGPFLMTLLHVSFFVALRAGTVPTILENTVRRVTICAHEIFLVIPHCDSAVFAVGRQDRNQALSFC
jgi:hypothetical protein